MKGWYAFKQKKQQIQQIQDLNKTTKYVAKEYEPKNKG